MLSHVGTQIIENRIQIVKHCSKWLYTKDLIVVKIKKIGVFNSIHVKTSIIKSIEYTSKLARFIPVRN